MFNLVSFLNKADSEFKFTFDMINFLYRYMSKILKAKKTSYEQFNIIRIQISLLKMYSRKVNK